MKLKLLLLISAITLLSLENFAQTSGSFVMGTHRTVFNACDVVVSDNGGLTGDYGNYRSDTITLFSGTPGSPLIKVSVLGLDIDEGDSLFFYNGAVPSATNLIQGLGALGATFLNNSNPIIVGAGGFAVQTTVVNPTGAMTIVFKSDGNTRAAGFELAVTCLESCQRIIGGFDNVLTTPRPHKLNPDDGYKYIDVCEGDSVKFVATATFLDNDLSYHQSLDSCTFFWNLGDISYTTYGVNTVYRYYVAGNGYEVVLQIKDQKNCFNSNSNIVRVRTSVNPIVQIAHLTDICQNATIDLRAGTSLGSDVIVSPFESNIVSTLSFDSTLFLPDGVCLGAGTQCYNSFLVFSSFAAGSTIQYSTDILSVCFTMEHSYLGDVKMSVVCPSGLSVQTHSQPHGNGLYLGLPYGLSNHGAFDVTSQPNNCNATVNPQGIGWNYCWSEVPTYGYHGGANNYLEQNQNNTPPGSGLTCDSTNRAALTNFYKPHNSFTGLLGCPLNGAWSIEICDLWAIDNGYIFQWQLGLDQRLLPAPWTYRVEIDSIYWTGQNVSYLNDSTFRANPTVPGINHYQFNLRDEFGCIYDTLVPLNVVPLPLPNLGPDTTFCENTPLVLDPHYHNTALNTSYNWLYNNSSGNNSDRTYLVSNAGQYIVTLTNDNGVVQCSNSDTMNVIVYKKPVISFYLADSIGCQPFLAKFLNYTTWQPGDTVSFKWNLGDYGHPLNEPTNFEPEHLYERWGGYNVKLVATTDKGCSDSIVKWDYVQVKKSPTAFYTASPNPTMISVNPTIQFTNFSENYNLGETTWLWDFKDGATSDQFSPTHTYTEPDDYRVLLTVTTAFGCTDTFSYNIIVEDEIFVPSLITPNNDGYNDILIIGNVNTNRDNILKIYNRYGKKVYEKKNYYTTSVCKKLDETGQKWDCASPKNIDKGWKAEGLSDGVYYYVFEYDGVSKKVSLNGSISIMSE